MQLTDVVPLDGAGRAEVCGWRGGRVRPEHPIAQAVVRAARAEVGARPPSRAFAPSRQRRHGRRPPGSEVGRKEGTTISRRTPRATRQIRDTAASERRGGTARGVGPHAGKPTGDGSRSGRAGAREVGSGLVVADVSPRARLPDPAPAQAAGEGRDGGGRNDAPALVQADLGLAIGTGTDVAIEAGDLTLVSGDLRAAVDAHPASLRHAATIRRNLFWPSLQCRGSHPTGDGRAAESDHRGRGHGRIQPVRRLELAAPAPLPRHPRGRLAGGTRMSCCVNDWRGAGQAPRTDRGLCAASSAWSTRSATASTS